MSKQVGNLCLCTMYCPPWFSDPIMMYDEGNSTQATYIIALSLSLLVYTCMYLHTFYKHRSLFLNAMSTPN